MDIFGIDETLAGLKRGAEKFGTRVAAAVVKRMARRVNASNGFSPREAEPYGAGMGGADTEQESQVPTQALNAHEHEDLSFPCDVCGKTMCPSCGGTSDAGATYHTKDCKARLRQQLKDAGATGSAARLNDGVDSSALGYQSAQRTTTAQRDDYCDACDRVKTGCICGMENALRDHCPSCGFAERPFSGACPQCGWESKHDLSNDGPLLSRCPACGLDSQEEWAGRCAGCGAENEKDAGGNAAMKENAAGGGFSVLAVAGGYEVVSADGSRAGEVFESRREAEARAAQLNGEARNAGGTHTKCVDCGAQGALDAMTKNPDGAGYLCDKCVQDRGMGQGRHIKENDDAGKEPWMMKYHNKWDPAEPEERAKWLKKAEIQGDLSVMESQKWSALPAFARKQLFEKGLLHSKENAGPKLPSELRDELSIKIYGKPYRELPDDGAEQDRVMAEFEKLEDSQLENAGKFYAVLDTPKAEVHGPLFDTRAEANNWAVEQNKDGKVRGWVIRENSIMANAPGSVYWDSMSVGDRSTWLGLAGIGDLAKGLAQLTWSQLPARERDMVARAASEHRDNVIFQNSMENAGHMGPDAWVAASLEERCAWLESAGLDVNLATLRFQDLSEDAHVALQDRMDMPASRNNLGSLAAGAKHGAASVESTGEDLPGPVSMGGGALGNASGPTKCSWCLGTGMGPCPKCEGEYETSKDCICKGTGHTKCADCKGTGKIENASGPTKIFSFKDANGEIETVAAESEQEAWQKLSRDFGTSIEDIHGMGIKLASVMENASDAFGRVLVCPRCKSNKLVPAPKEYGNGYYECSACGDGTWSRAELIDMDSFKNSKVQEPCPTCGLPKQMRPVGGDDDSFVCGNRKCSSFKNDIDLEDHGTHKKCPVCAGPVKWQEGLGQSSHEYACARCGQNFDETELKNANSVGDLEEIARHAEGIEHEIGEMMENSAWKHRKVGDFTYSSGSAAGRDECTECGKSIKTGDKVTLVTSGDVSDGNATDIYCANCTPSEARNDGRIDNRAIPESKIGEEIAHHIKDKGMDPDQAVAAAYSETRNSGVSRGQDKYGSKDK